MTEPTAAAGAEPRFAQRLEAIVMRRSSQLVLGIDPHPERLWPEAIAGGPAHGSAGERAAAATTAHCRALVEAAGRSCVAVKLQLACFERLGAAGRESLEAVVAHARGQGLLVIADGKRGDIDVSATAYAEALMGATETPFGRVAGLGADAVTVNPLMGRDALAPFLDVAARERAGVFVLVRTSNPGAADVEDQLTAGGAPLWERIAEIVADRPATDGLSDVGAVVGATAPEHIARMRELMPHAIFLLPGIGAQGGAIADVAPAFAAGPASALVTASRSISDAHAADGGAREPGPAAAAAAEGLRAAAWALGGSA